MLIRPISDKALRALDHSWHVVCFVCKVDARESSQIRLIYVCVRSVACLLRARRVSTQWTVTLSAVSVLETQDLIKHIKHCQYYAKKYIFCTK